MKTAFKILPVNSNVNSGELLIEIGWKSISFVYFSKQMVHINALFVYHFEDSHSPSEMAAELKALFSTENLPAYTQVFICYNFRECSIVPAPVFKMSALPEIVNCLYPVKGPSAYYTEVIEAINAVAAYRIDERIEEVLSGEFAAAKKHHSLALQVQMLSGKENYFYCIIYQNSLKVILFKNNTLQLAQFFDYTTPTDVAYHLLNICAQHNLSPQEITLTVSGFIDLKSNLYDELYRYFLHIELGTAGIYEEQSSAVKQYPEQFFSHLMSLAQCVS